MVDILDMSMTMAVVITDTMIGPTMIGITVAGGMAMMAITGTVMGTTTEGITVVRGMMTAFAVGAGMRTMAITVAGGMTMTATTAVGDGNAVLTATAEVGKMQAMLWTPQADGSVQCRLCMHRCHLRKGGKGRCGVRVNLRAALVSLVNEVVTSVAVDPVEKKPLYHFLPGTKIFSVGSAGCNFSCRFCQNNAISQVPENGTVAGRRVAPEELVALAAARHVPSMAFTYNEPTVFFELVYETARLARQKGMANVLVTNGYMSQDCLRALQANIRAANVDLKGFRDEFYRTYCGGRLQPVLDNLKAIKGLGWWLEVTTLVIPGVNDSAEELKDIATFIHDELGVDTPWHVSAFHGAHLMSAYPATPPSKLQEAWQIGRDVGLRYVYIGNIRSEEGSTTLCPNPECGATVITRDGYSIRMAGEAGVCPSCGTRLPGVWQL